MAKFFFLLTIIFIIIPTGLLIWGIAYVIRKRKNTTEEEVKLTSRTKLAVLKKQLSPWLADSFLSLSPGYITTNSQGIKMNKRSGFFLGQDREKLIAFAMGDKAAFWVNETTYFSNSQDQYRITTEKEFVRFYKNDISLGSYTLNKGLQNENKVPIGSFTIKFLNTNLVDDREHFHFKFNSGLEGYIVNIKNRISGSIMDYTLYSSNIFKFEKGMPDKYEEDILLCLFVLISTTSWIYS